MTSSSIDLSNNFLVYHDGTNDPQENAPSTYSCLFKYCPECSILDQIHNIHNRVHPLKFRRDQMSHKSRIRHGIERYVQRGKDTQEETVPNLKSMISFFWSTRKRTTQMMWHAIQVRYSLIRGRNEFGLHLHIDRSQIFCSKDFFFPNWNSRNLIILFKSWRVKCRYMETELKLIWIKSRACTYWKLLIHLFVSFQNGTKGQQIKLFNQFVLGCSYMILSHNGKL